MPQKKSGRSASKKAGGGARSKGSGRPTFLSDGDKGTRLQKFLASAGVDSRRNCVEFITSGRVTVDGEVIKNPAVSVNPELQDVRLDGERLKMPRFRYFLLNKPKGVVCTNNDPAGRPRAVDLIPHTEQRLFTVGRLDENTEGLLLITNDGALAEHLAHPRYEVVRRYRAQVAGIPTAATLNELSSGMYFSDGFFRFQHIRAVKKKGRSTILEMELREGKNREIRRLLARVGHKVIHLERVAFGPLRIGRLEVGQFRELGSKELSELYAFIRSAPHTQSPGPRRPRKSKPAAGKRSGPRTADSKKVAKSESRRGVARNKKAGGAAPKRKPAGVRKKQRPRRK